MLTPLDKKRFIGEHRGEFKRRDGRGEARRGAPQQSARLHTAESSKHLTLQLGWSVKMKKKIPACFLVQYLNAYLHDLFLSRRHHWFHYYSDAVAYIS